MTTGSVTLCSTTMDQSSPSKKAKRKEDKVIDSSALHEAPTSDVEMLQDDVDNEVSFLCSSVSLDSLLLPLGEKKGP